MPERLDERQLPVALEAHPLGHGRPQEPHDPDDVGEHRFGRARRARLAGARRPAAAAGAMRLAGARRNSTSKSPSRSVRRVKTAAR